MEIVKYLHERGADLNAINNEGYFPLYYGNIKLNLIIFYFCLYLCFFTTPAIIYCNFDLLAYLANHGADLNLKDNYGNTALHKGILEDCY